MSPFESTALVFERRSRIEVEWCNKLIDSEMIKNLFDYSIKCDELSTDTNIKANIIENGHYTSIVKVDAKWIFFDDSKYEEVKDPHQLISERAHVLSEKAKSNCKKIFCDFFFEGEPVRVKDEEGFVVKVKGDKIVIRFVLGVIKTLSRKNVEKLLSVEG